MVLSQAKNDSPTHLHLDHEQECMDDDDIICAYTMGDAVCNSTINWLMGQLVEKGAFIDQNRQYYPLSWLRPNQVEPDDHTSRHARASVLVP